MHNKVRILFIIDWLGRSHGGGTENHLANVVAHLNKDIFECFVCVLDDSSGPLVDKIEKHALVKKISIKKFYAPRNLIRFKELVDFIVESKADIVQTIHFKSDTYGVLAAKLSGVPKIVSSRRDLGDLKRWRHILFNKMANRFIDRFIVACDAIGDSCSRKENIRSDKITTIYNGVDISSFSPRYEKDRLSARRGIGLEDDAFVVGSLAHFRPEKAYHVYFEGLRLLKPQLGRFFAVVIGNGTERSRFETSCEETGLSGYVKFLGAVEDVPRYLSLMDVLCLVPNKNEGFSNAILEGMAMGLPIVATDVGGNSEAVVDGETGFVIPADDPEAFAGAVLELFKEPLMRKRMGLRGRQRSEEKFTLHGMIREFENFYLRLSSQN